MADGMNRKTILITGASSGIGAAVAREFAKAGHNLAITARRLDRLEGLAAELEEHGVEVLVLPASLDDPETPERLIGATVERFGRLDGLVNNAGYGVPSLFAQTEPSEIRRQFEVNLVAPVLLARCAIPHLIESRGTIINIGSAITAVPNPIFGVYGTTKAALAWWTDALRRELLRRKVRVCLVEPGPVHTEFFDALQDRAPGTSGRILDKPPAILHTTVDVAARRIARLIDHPRRRLSVLKRVAWPFRGIGLLFRLWPWLGDQAIAPMPNYMPPLEEPAEDAVSTRSA
ncbi:SDR family NAD(P)-dependent oxidoreductase [Tundrisphaera lichenicola]|uniref:SDR family NAD(P)-dependent oxidoreductase n=1 Tax=Tundrisphaera lichenicola TaxID=2029860 RepID=UPI003EBA6EBF